MLIAAMLFLLAVACAVALQVDDWSRDLSTNRAATSSTALDPTLRSLSIEASPKEVHTAITAFAARSSLWSVPTKVHEQPDSHSLRLVRTSRLFRFADDVEVTLQPIPLGTRVDVVSQSRIGKGDLGQNPRNIRQLLQALRDTFHLPQ